LQPKIELIVSLHYVQYLIEYIQELGDIYLESHFFAFFSNFLDEVNYQCDQIIWYDVILILFACLMPNVLQTIIDNLNESIRILHKYFNLNLLNRLRTENY
jgi:hypothetical protein